MSIALERMFTGGIGPRLTAEAAGKLTEDQTFRSPHKAAEEEEGSCSSSIGRDSDCSETGSDGGGSSEETEVQSSYKGPLDTMDALEESLPIRRSISKFYCGKSKSFTSLADASSSSSSTKDLAKPENPFNRKRKIFLSCANISDLHRNIHINPFKGGLSKRPMNSSRSSSPISSTESHNNHQPRLPPLHPQLKVSELSTATGSNWDDNNNTSPPQKSFSSSLRSYSLSDLSGVR
ncbi:hypothetical protein QJS10_CPB19g01894 [Acorus calamus]|uniref:MTD1 n=1 Tax=Acorus calamus TaxID=4465 RepID=A0AAV9CJR8_ACOCL|nr:hypothetical protein QJS10_CPB19g01894 [Acorus calamus]